MKTRPLAILIVAINLLFLCGTLNAQVTIGSDLEPASGALIDVKQNAADNGGRTSTKGIVLPRVELQSLTSLAPLVDPSASDYALQKTKHRGVFVYNIKVDATADLEESTYFWNGNNWTPGTPGGAWNSTVTKKPAKDQSDNIYFPKNVGLGTDNPQAALHIQTSGVGFILNDGNQPGPGSERVLIYKGDNGYATWETNIAITPTVPGNLPLSGQEVNITGYGSANAKYTGAYIDLEPGRWMVSFGTAAGNTQNNTVLGSNYQYWYKVGLCDSNTAGGYSPSSSIRTNLTGTHGAGMLGSGARLTLVTGNIAVLVEKNDPLLFAPDPAYPDAKVKRLYLWAEVEGFGNYPGSPAFYWLQCFGSFYGERWFYATPMN